MKSAPWLLVAAVAVLVLGSMAAWLLADLQEDAVRTALGVGIATATAPTAVIFMLTYLLQSVVSQNTSRQALLLSRDLSLFDFQGVDLRGVNLRGRKLSGCNLKKADLRSADLSRCDLRGANLAEADLRDADLSGADLRAAYLRRAHLHRARMWDVKLSGSNLTKAGLRHADLAGAQAQPLTDEEIDDLYAAHGRVHFWYSAERVKSAPLWRTTWLEGADMFDANLTGCDLREADLTDACLAHANLADWRSDATKPMPAEHQT